jgi:hypothetical protein
VRLGAVSRVPGTRWRHYATTMMVTGTMLAGCSSQPAATGVSVTSCSRFAARAIQRHVTVTGMPAACRGLSQVEVNVAVSLALRAATAGVRGKVRQRQVIARDSRYVAGLIHAVPATGQPTVTAPQSRLPGQAPVAAPPSRPPSRAALSLAALVAWLVTVGLGVSMMARWITQTRRPGPRPRLGRGPVLNFTHFGLALTGLLAWITYLATGVTGLAWAACGLLLAAASLGMTLVFLPPSATADTARLGDDRPSAGHPPVLVIAAHITAACITILLATLVLSSLGTEHRRQPRAVYCSADLVTGTVDLKNTGATFVGYKNIRFPCSTGHSTTRKGIDANRVLGRKDFLLDVLECVAAPSGNFHTHGADYFNRSVIKLSHVLWSNFQPEISVPIIAVNNNLDYVQ